MGFLISLAAKAVGERFAPLLAYGTVIALLVGALLWLRHDAYQDGEAANEAKWIAAGETFEQAAEEAQTAADAASAARAAREFERVREEKEKIDAATAQGTSPLDVLFGSDSLPGEAGGGAAPDPG